MNALTVGERISFERCLNVAAMARKSQRLLVWMWLIGSLCLLLASTAWPKPVKKLGQWSLVETSLGDRPNCILLGAASQDTLLTLKIDSGDQARSLISFQFVNLNWSIKAGDDLGEMALMNASGGPKFIPIAGDRGFFLYLDADSTEAWLKLGDEQGTWLERDGTVIERLNTGNLVTEVVKLRKCGAKLYADDPFGK